MIEQQTAAPEAVQAVAGGQLADTTIEQAAQSEQGEQTEEQKAAAAQPKELTAEEKRIKKLDNDVRRLLDSRGRARQERDEFRQALKDLQERSIGDTNQPADGDSETISLSKADFERKLREGAEKLVPDLMRQKREEERLVSAAKSLHDKVGKARFDEITEELDYVLPKEHQFMLLRAKDAVEVMSYLTDPDNADELKALGGMDAFDAGQEIGDIRAKLKAKKESLRLLPSKAAAPLEPVRGGGTVNSAPDPSDTKAWIKFENEREKRRAT